MNTFKTVSFDFRFVFGPFKKLDQEAWLAWFIVMTVNVSTVDNISSSKVYIIANVSSVLSHREKIYVVSVDFSSYADV